MKIKLIIGTGDQELRHMFTRHNAGIRLINALSDGRIFAPDALSESNILESSPEALPSVLAKPTAGLPSMGRVARTLLEQRGLSTQEMLVLCDNPKLAMGSVRISKGGKAGRHPGIRSIKEAFDGDKLFGNLELGVGPLPPMTTRRAFTDSVMTGSELVVFEEMIAAARVIVLSILRRGLDEEITHRNMGVPARSVTINTLSVSG